jgi:hypothetical protein
MSDNYERLRKWAKDAASGKSDKIPYIDITDLINEVVTLRAAQPVVLSDEQIIAAFEPHIDSDPAAPHDMPTYWVRQDELIAYTRAILSAKEQA